MNRKLFESLQRASGHDPGCEDSFARLDQYADAVLEGLDASALFPGIAVHLQQCDACREDTEGLVEALRAEKNISPSQ